MCREDSPRPDVGHIAKAWADEYKSATNVSTASEFDYRYFGFSKSANSDGRFLFLTYGFWKLFGVRGAAKAYASRRIPDGEEAGAAGDPRDGRVPCFSSETP